MAFQISFDAQKTEDYLRFFAIYCVLILTLILDIVAINIPNISDIRPNLTLITLYYWWIYRPSLLPSWLTFALGLGLDALSGVLFGLHALTFVLLQKIITDQRKLFLGQPFITILTGYCVCLVLYLFIQWGISSLFYGLALPLIPIIGSIIVGIFIFPCIIVILNRLHRLLPYRHTAVGPL